MQFVIKFKIMSFFYKATLTGWIYSCGIMPEYFRDNSKSVITENSVKISGFYAICKIKKTCFWS